MADSGSRRRDIVSDGKLLVFAILGNQRRALRSFLGAYKPAADVSLRETTVGNTGQSPDAEPVVAVLLLVAAFR
jgi:hypothetical protein